MFCRRIAVCEGDPPMRLTLRTLLAYLDDTLEPGEIKQIGQKVAESDAAQELVARIKQVTRRRRLTTPSDAGPGERFDANRVAAYLDNDLASEDVAELEKLCLESDVHLAEIAAAHQILTLVLGEPALVPPTAKRRMYALQHGRPARASTKPPPVTKTGAEESKPANGLDPDDSLMALPLFRQLPWLRWALPLAAVVLLSVLGVFLWNTLNKTDTKVTTRGDSRNGSQQDDKDKIKPDDKDKIKPDDRDKIKPDDKDKIKPDDKDKKSDDKSIKTEPDKVPPIGKPNMDRQAAGTFVSPEQVLVRRDTDGWKRIGLNDVVNTGETLVSLPGYKSELRLDKKVKLLMWGNLPEQFPERMLETAVTLHHTGSDALDLDVTLHRGRIYLSNRKEKGPARVRLRFWREEVWDLTLAEPDTTVAIQLLSLSLPFMKPLEGEEPFVPVAFFVLKGEASLKVGLRTVGNLRAPPGFAALSWNNKGRGLSGPDFVGGKVPEWEEIEPPLPMNPRDADAAKAMKLALSELASALTRPEKKVEVALLEFTQAARPEHRQLAIRCLGAIDAIGVLLDVAANEDPQRFDVRREALFALRHWLSRGLEQGAKLYDKKKKTGVLVEKDYSQREAEIIIDLLYGPALDTWERRETFEVLIYYLRNSKLIIRELAIQHLMIMSRGQKAEYNPAGTLEARERGYEAWKKLLDDKKLPPPPPMPMPMPPK
jgi:hypothetical protein